MDGLPALELWDLIVSVLGNVSRVSDRSGKPESDVHKHHKSHKKIDVIKDIDAVPSNVQSARQEASLYMFEHNEAVIKMVVKGRSPTMRPVSRTHRVALDWLFDRIYLDSKIQVKYIDTKNQLADILTKGSFAFDQQRCLNESEEQLLQSHQDHITVKGDHALSHYGMLYAPVAVPETLKNPAANNCVRQRME